MKQRPRIYYSASQRALIWEIPKGRSPAICAVQLTLQAESVNSIQLPSTGGHEWSQSKNVRGSIHDYEER
jgi:hypothetical protein